MNRRQNTYIMEKSFKGIVSDAGELTGSMTGKGSRPVSSRHRQLGGQSHVAWKGELFMWT